jgi:hypothetical protein
MPGPRAPTFSRNRTAGFACLFPCRVNGSCAGEIRLPEPNFLHFRDSDRINRHGVGQGGRYAPLDEGFEGVQVPVAQCVVAVEVDG